MARARPARPREAHPARVLRSSARESPPTPQPARPRPTANVATRPEAGLTQRRREPQRAAEGSLSLRSSAFLCASALNLRGLRERRDVAGLRRALNFQPGPTKPRFLALASGRPLSGPLASLPPRRGEHKRDTLSGAARFRSEEHTSE